MNEWICIQYTAIGWKAHNYIYYNIKLKYVYYYTGILKALKSSSKIKWKFKKFYTRKMKNNEIYPPEMLLVLGKC